MMMVMVMSVSMACVACVGLAGVACVAMNSGFLDTLTGEAAGTSEPACNSGADSEYSFKRRVEKDGTWKCEDGWEDTGCGWVHGAELGEKQCQKKK